jgi:hypothetical protein
MGALTSKPFAFTARTWELKSVNSIDITDGEGSMIKLQIRGNEILRVLPNYTGKNIEWISNKARFNYDALARNRLSFPFLQFDILNTKFISNLMNFRLVNLFGKRLTWEIALIYIKKKFLINKNTRVITLLSPVIDLNNFFSLKTLMSRAGSSDLIYEVDNNSIKGVVRNLNSIPNTVINKFMPYFNNNFIIDEQYTYKTIDFQIKLDEADFIFLINTNVRLQSPVLFSQIKKFLSVKSERKLILFNSSSSGFSSDYTINLGSSLTVLKRLLQGRHRFSWLLSSSLKPLFICDEGYNIEKFNSYMDLLFSFYFKIFKMDVSISTANSSYVNWNPFFLLRNGANQSAFSFFQNLNVRTGLVHNKKNSSNLNSTKYGLIILGDNSKVLEMIDFKKFEFVIHQKWFMKTQVELNQPVFLLPFLNATETKSVYINQFHQLQKTDISVNVTDTETDRAGWHIIQALATIWFNELLWLDEEDLLISMEKIEPFFDKTDFFDLISNTITLQNTAEEELVVEKEDSLFNGILSLTNNIFSNNVKDRSLLAYNVEHDHYVNDPVSSNSASLNLAQKIRLTKEFNNFSTKY